jgi:hypothetical protein
MSDTKNSGATILLFLLCSGGAVGLLSIDTTSITDPVEQPPPISEATVQPTPNFTSEIGGSFMTNYFMRVTSGSTYQVVDSNNTLFYTSQSSSAAFNWLLGPGGHATPGDAVYVEAGAYSVDATWNINVAGVTVTFQHPGAVTPNVMGNLCGSGTTSPANGAVLTAVNSLNNPVIKVNVNAVTITGATIDCNGVNQYGANGLHSNWSWAHGIDTWASNDVLQYCTIYNCAFDAVEVLSGSNSGIQNCLIYNVGWNGFTSYGAANAFCLNSEFYYVNDVAICSYGNNNVLAGNYVHDLVGGSLTHGFGYWGIGLEGEGTAVLTGCGTGGGDYLLIANNRLERMYCGIYLGDTADNYQYIIVCGNTLTDCTGNHYYAAIAPTDNFNNGIISYNGISNCDVAIGIHYSNYHGGTSCWDNYVYGNTYNGSPIGLGSPYIKDYGINTMYSQPSTVAYTVTSSPVGTGFVSVGGSYGYAGANSTSPYTLYRTVGTTITLSAKPTGFTSWSDGGALTHTLTIPSVYTVYTATYGGPSPATVSLPTFSSNPVEINHPITVNVNVTGTPAPTGTVVFYYSTTNGASWTPYSVKLLVSGSAVSDTYTPTTAGTQLHKVVYGGDSTYSPVTSSNAQLTVTDSGPVDPGTLYYFYVKVQSAGVGGSSTPAASATPYQYIVGQTVTLTAYPNQNYTFNRWLLNGSLYSTNPIVQLTGAVNQTYTLQPEFTANVIPPGTLTTWTLTTSTQGNGTISPATGSHVETTLSIYITATAGAGYVFDSFIIDGVSYVDNPYYYTSVFGASHTVVAVFTPESTVKSVVNQEASKLLDTTMTKLQNAVAPSFEVALAKLKEAGLA